MKIFIAFTGRTYMIFSYANVKQWRLLNPQRAPLLQTVNWIELFSRVWEHNKTLFTAMKTLFFFCVFCTFWTLSKCFGKTKQIIKEWLCHKWNLRGLTSHYFFNDLFYQSLSRRFWDGRLCLTKHKIFSLFPCLGLILL